MMLVLLRLLFIMSRTKNRYVNKSYMCDRTDTFNKRLNIVDAYYDKNNHIEINNIKKDNIYKVGIYARVSVDNKDNSIENQIELAKEYMEGKNDIATSFCPDNINSIHGNIIKDRIIFDKYELVSVYIDKGCSGKNYDRKAYIRMINDIDNKIINCIIVKDISRLGRNYLETGLIIEHDLYKKGVRIIAINDRYDSKYCDEYMKNNLLLHNLINEIYLKDTSSKIKKSKEYLKQVGAYTGVYAPYGYRIEGKGSNRILVKDSESYIIVEEIIRLCNDGLSYTDISKYLYKKGVNTKEDYRKSGKIYSEVEETKVWSVKSICDVINKERIKENKNIMNKV